MNTKHKILSVILATILLTASLTACKGGDDPAETGTGTGDSTTGTTAPGEQETAIPRFDYMADNVSANVTIDRAAYTDLVLTVPNSLKVDDEDVEEYIESIRFQYRTAVNGTTMVKDKPLAMGDEAYIYYKGFLNGEAFEGGSNWDDDAPYTLGLGSGKFIPGFEEALVGIIPNTTSKSAPAEITVTFPENYNDELSGKEAVFQVVVEYAVQYTVAEYNREFVETTLKYKPQKEFYASDEALLDEFEEYVKEYLIAQTINSLENAKNGVLWDHLTDASVCTNLPETEVAYYYDVYLSEATYYYDSYKYYSGEEFLKQYPDIGSFAMSYFDFAQGTDWKAELTEMARQMVCRDMITHAIAEQEGLETVTREEFDATVKYWKDYYSSGSVPMSEEDVIARMGSVFLTESALSNKMNEWLMQQVAFTYEDGTPIVSTTENDG